MSAADADSVREGTPSARATPASASAAGQRSRQGSMASASQAAAPSSPAPAPGTPTRSGAATPPTQPRSRGPSVVSGAGAAPLQKQGSSTSLRSAAAASAAAAAAEVMSPGGGGGSRRGSVRSNVSGAATPMQQTVTSVAHDGASQLPQTEAGGAEMAAAAGAGDEAPHETASVHTAEGAAVAAATPEAAPAVELTVEEKLAQAERDLAQANARIHSLEQTNASMQRLMSSGSADSKIKLLTQDLHKRAEKCKALEQEVKKLTKRAEEAERNAKATSAREKRASRSSVNLSAHGSSQDKALIKELQQKLSAAEARLASGDADHQQHSSDSQVISKLQTMLAEKEAEKQMLKQKLEQAQDAIVSSAGAGFENEVKLQQARSALQTILASQSPQRSVASPQQSMRAMSPAGAMLHTSTGASPLAQHHSITSSASRPRAYYETASPSSAARFGSASPLSSYPYGGAQRRDRSPPRNYSSSPRY